MGTSAAIFESAGKRTEHYVPGVYSRSYNVTSASGVSSGNLCIMGRATGGKPQTLLEFGSISEAKETLVDGELLKAVSYAFNGSNDYVPQRVYAMRVNPGTQSNLTLSASDLSLLKLTSWDYGSHTNQLKLSIASGSVNNSKVITVVYKNNTITSEDITKPSIKILGQGNATVTISATQMVLSTIPEGETEAVTTTLSFDDFPTLLELVNRINDTAYFTASLVDVTEDAKSSSLDTVASASVTSENTFYSNFQAIVDYLEACPYIASVEKLTTATRTTPDNIDYSYFAGGTAGTYTASDWNNALSALETEDIQIIATPASDISVLTLIANHCTTMSSTVNRKERMALLGGGIGLSDDDGIANAKAFNNKLVSYVIDNVSVTSPLTGETETISGSYLACMLAGMESSMAVNIPLTNKTIKVLGFSKIRSLTNLEKLIKAGILVCNPNPDNVSNYVVIRAITTYQSSDLISNERSMTREALYMDRDLRNRYAGFIGNPNTMGTSTIRQKLIDAAQEWVDSGYIVASDNNENVWNISVSINGDKIYITYSRYLTAPTNFIFITAANHVYTTTTTI